MLPTFEPPLGALLSNPHKIKLRNTFFFPPSFLMRYLVTSRHLWFVLPLNEYSILHETNDEFNTRGRDDSGAKVDKCSSEEEQAGRKPTIARQKMRKCSGLPLDGNSYTFPIHPNAYLQPRSSRAKRKSNSKSSHTPEDDVCLLSF